jgi:hypothetical protein
VSAGFAGCLGPADQRQRSIIRIDGLILHAVLMFQTVELVEPSDVRWRRILRLKFLAGANGCYRKGSIAHVSRHRFDVKTIAMFCAVGLTVYFLVASYGLDLSSGFF